MTSTEFFFDRSIEVYELDGKIFSFGISKFFQPLFESCPQWSRAGLNRRDTRVILRGACALDRRASVVPPPMTARPVRKSSRLMDFSPLRVLRCKSLAQSSNDYGVVALQQIGAARLPHRVKSAKHSS
jgi:hypothetical protein